MLQTSRSLGYHVPRADLPGCSVCSTTQCLQPAACSPCPRSHSPLYKAGSPTRLCSQSASISWFFAVKVFRGITQPQPAHQGMHVASKTSFLGAKQKLILFHPAKYIKLWAPTNKTCFTVPILPPTKSPSLSDHWSSEGPEVPNRTPGFSPTDLQRMPHHRGSHGPGGYHGNRTTGSS